jgi:hypothetical protein
LLASGRSQERPKSHRQGQFRTLSWPSTGQESPLLGHFSSPTLPSNQLGKRRAIVDSAFGWIGVANSSRLDAACQRLERLSCFDRLPELAADSQCRRAEPVPDSSPPDAKTVASIKLERRGESVSLAKRTCHEARIPGRYATHAPKPIGPRGGSVRRRFSIGAWP